MMTHCDYIVGIDEAGRGPLAGPVYVGAVLLPSAMMAVESWDDVPGRLADSKQLSEQQREAWLAWMDCNNIAYAHSWSGPSVIDTINIRNATNAAAQRAFDQLTKGVEGAISIIADGGLVVHTGLHPFLSSPKADETEPVVSLASIVAKVLRDRYIVRAACRYPHYGFERHKGYGTKDHIAALREHGHCPIHRKTFITRFII